MPAACQANSNVAGALDVGEAGGIGAEVQEEEEDEELAVEIVADNGEEHLRRLFPEDDNVQVSTSRQLWHKMLPKIYPGRQNPRA